MRLLKVFFPHCPQVLFLIFISFEMTYVGNYICILFVVLETILLNGVFVGWGILTAVFKEDELFFLDENWQGLYRFSTF